MIVGHLEVVFVLAWYLKWTELVMIVGCLWLVRHWQLNLVEKLEAVEALRCSLGPGVILAYVRAGLFHPARRVREVYWRLYNNLVVYSGHALVAYLPGIPEEGSEGGEGGAGGGAKYRRTMLELCL